MDSLDENNTLLSHWLKGTLTQKQKATFEQSEAYRDYKKIIDTVDGFSTPSGDQEKVLLAIYNNTQKKTTRVRKLTYWGSVMAAAAAIILLFFVLHESSTTYRTDFGEQLSMNLPDGSQVRLNAKSELSFKEGDWSENREVFLEGEAFFEVQKGSDFLVKSKNGTVKVLGTRFTTLSQQDFFEVVCYQGKVKAHATDQKAIVLTKGNAIRVNKDGTEQWNTDGLEPGWMANETSFTDAPLPRVLLALEKQFNIDFDSDKCDLDRRYTGSYTHEDLQKALKTVFKPMRIPYIMESNNVVTLCSE